jgi:hypothetical protein
VPRLRLVATVLSSERCSVRHGRRLHVEVAHADGAGDGAT